MLCGLVLMRQAPGYALRRKLAAALSQKNFKWGHLISRIRNPCYGGSLQKEQAPSPLQPAYSTLLAWFIYKLSS